MSKLKVVCFDLDDTLIREVHSVMLPCILNGKEKEHTVIQEKEENGLLGYKEADYMRAELFIDLKEEKISQSFLEIAKPLKNIGEVIEILHENDILCVVITVGPKQVAKVVSEIWGFDEYYGSDYEVINGLFTGKINKYIGAEEKILCLQDFCRKNNISAEECYAVGDGSTDIPVFEFCNKSIAINSNDDVKNKATYSVETDDLNDVLEYLL